MLIKEGNKIKKLLFNISGVWISEALTLMILFMIQIFSAKLLGPSDYGLFAALNSITTVFTALSHGVRVAFARTTADNILKERQLRFHPGAIRIPLIGGSVLAILLVLIAPFLFDVLSFSSFQFVLAISLNLPLVLLIFVLMGAVQGTQNFKLYSLIIIFQSLIRLMSTFGILILGFGIGGMLWAIFLTNVVILTFFTPLCLRSTLINTDYTNMVRISRTNVVQLSFLIVALLLSLHASADVFIARNLLDPDSAGTYALIAITGKIVLYSPMAIVFVIFPKMVAFGGDVKNVRDIFVKALVISCTASLLVSIILFFGIETIVSLIFGPSYTLVPYIVFLYSLGMIVLSINHQIFSLFLALSVNNKYIYISTCIYTLGFIFIGLVGHSVLKISASVLIVNLVVLVMLFPAMIKILFFPKNRNV